MQIAGLQKLTLIDYPGKIACTIFLFGCNFRCRFCHNPELVLSDKGSKTLEKEEILFFLQKRKRYLDGICITGGEPLLHQDLPELLQDIRKLGYNIKIDTNGSNPGLLKEIIRQGLVDYIAMDIKADKNNYDIISGVEVDIKKIEDSIQIIANSGLGYEFRTTVVRGHHNIGNLMNIAQWLQDLIQTKPKKFAIQRFIPREGKIIDEKFEKIREFDDKELEEMREAIQSYFEEVEVRN